MGEGLEIRFWGTRGSCAAPFLNRMEFGGNTSCVSVRRGGELVVFDGGTGIAALGAWLDEQAARGLAFPVIHIFMSHLHLDHVCGLPFFSAFFQPGREIHLYGRPGETAHFREELCRAAGPPCWPLTPDAGAAKVVWHDLRAGESREILAGGHIWAMGAEHPDQSLMYRLELDGMSVVYGLDCELTVDIREDYRVFAAGCDLLIFDGMYTDEEYPRYRGFGHGTWQQGAAFGRECGAGLVCVSHHDWRRTDEELRRLERQARELYQGCVFAREGVGVWIGGGEVRLTEG